MNFSRTTIWRWAREQRILARHRRVAHICETLLATYRKNLTNYDFVPKVTFDTENIIWQYWAQGYNDVPPVVKDCLDSVDKYADGYRVIRLSDTTITTYIDLPEFLTQKRGLMTTAHFSDLLRLILLKTYGGIWMDATIMLTGAIPKEYSESEFFVFRRDPLEPNYRYWRNVYAYYFGWAKGFRVNMLSSFMVAKRGNRIVSEICDLMLTWWRHNDNFPDYFFLQIMFDVYWARSKSAFMLVSDTHPHYLQQFIKDPDFYISSRVAIEELCSIHKLSYK